MSTVVVPRQPVVVNVRRTGDDVPWGSGDSDVYIGRGSKWGNPFPIDADHDRANVIATYRVHINESADLMESLPELTGKRLGCYCKPQACHGDILARIADGGEI